MGNLNGWLWRAVFLSALLCGVSSQQTEISADELNEGIGWESTLFAGSGVPAFRDDVGKDAHFNFMQTTKWLVGIDVDRNGRFALISDQYNQRIRHVNLTTAEVTTFIKLDDSADPTTVVGWSRANSLKGVSISPDGTKAVVANSYNATSKLNNDQKLMWIDIANMTWEPVRNMTDDLGDPILPWAVAMDGNDAAYVVNNALSIVRVDLNTRATTHIAGKTGTGAGTKGYVDGIGTNAAFEHPMGMALDLSSPPRYLYVTDQLACVRRIDLATNQVTTIAGSPSTLPLVDGQVARGYVESETAGAQDARFSFPAGLAVVPSVGTPGASTGTRVVVADAGNHAIRMLTLNTGNPPVVVRVQTLTGGPFRGYQNGFPELAKFFGPSDVAMFPGGLRMLVTEQENNLVREVSLSCRGYSYLCGDECCDCNSAGCPAGDFRGECVRSPTDGPCLSCKNAIPAFALFVDNTAGCEFQCQSGFTLVERDGQTECFDPNADTDPPSSDHPSFMDNVWVPVSVVLTVVVLALLLALAWRFLRMPVVSPAAADAVSREYGGGKVTADAIWYPQAQQPAPPPLPPPPQMSQPAPSVVPSRPGIILAT